MYNLILLLFAALLVISSGCVIVLRNSVHAVMSLIFAFLNAAAMMLMVGAEYVAMTVIIVYVGAVAILFLSVIMMLDYKSKKGDDYWSGTAPVALLLAVVACVEIYYAFVASPDSLIIQEQLADSYAARGISNVKAIGMQLYTDYFLEFQVTGMILLTSMVGAIVLTLTGRPKGKRQDVRSQLARMKADTLKMVKIQSSKGIKI